MAVTDLRSFSSEASLPEALITLYREVFLGSVLPSGQTGRPFYIIALFKENSF